MNENTDDIIYFLPDALTYDQLVGILTKRMVLCNDNRHCPLQKEHLIGLFRKFIVPLPPRVKNRKIEDKERPREMVNYIRRISLQGKR